MITKSEIFEVDGGFLVKKSTTGILQHIRHGNICRRTGQSEIYVRTALNHLPNLTKHIVAIPT